ncbi:MAG: hypothetical protein RL215_334 [Planctomycetota bacterium]
MEWWADGPVASVAEDASVEGITFDGDASGFADEAVDLIDGHAFGCFGAGIVVDEFVDDGAVDVIGAVAECELCGLFSEHDPVGLDVIEVIKEEAGECDHAEVEEDVRFGD